MGAFIASEGGQEVQPSLEMKDGTAVGDWGLDLDLQLGIRLLGASSEETTRGTRGVHRLPCRLTPLWCWGTHLLSEPQFLHM